MTDSFLVLTPLLVLPIILLFTFVGCALDSEGSTFVPLVLHVDAGLDTDVKTIDVIFSYSMFDTDLFHEVMMGNGQAAIFATNDSILAGGGSFGVDTNDLNLKYRADITCQGIVMTSPDLSDESILGTPHILDPVKHEKESDESPPVFNLHRSGTTFTLG
jgi:hypothetical protein